MLEELKPALQEQGVHFNYTPETLEWIAKQSYGHKRGARDIRRVIRKEVEDPLCMTLATTQTPPSLVLAEVREDKIALRTEV